VRLRDLWRNRAIIRIVAARDFKVKYKQSLLGPLWVALQPLLLLLAFIVAFRGIGNVRTSGVPYAVFALAGLTAWSFFQAAMTIGTSSLISNSNFVRYTSCPRVAFPAAAVIASVPMFVVTAAGTIVAAALTGHLSPRVLLLPFGFVWLLLLTAGVVATSCSLAVRYRDVINALPFLLQVGMFLAPVGYSLAGLSPTLRRIVEINPLTGLIEALRWMLLSGYRPTLGPVVLSLAVSAVLLVVGWRLFTRRETTVADEI
jgi:ABC-type polysaccharide/polyol phosphate export permease